MNKIVDLKCSSCGCNVHSLMAICEYCGNQILSNKELDFKDKEKILWIAEILNSRIWKISIEKKYKRVLTLSFSLFAFLIIYFSLSYFFTSSYAWVSLLIGLIYCGNVYSAYYNELEYYHGEIVKNEAYYNSVKDIIDEFLRGNNYFKFDFERMIEENYKKHSLSTLVKFNDPIETSDKKNPNMNLRVLGKLCKDYSREAYMRSTFWCGLIPIVFGAIALLIYFILNYFGFFFTSLLITLPILLLFYLESWDKTDFLFSIIDYAPSEEYQKDVLLRRLKNYCAERKINFEDMKILVNQNAGNYYEISKVIKAYS